MAESDQPTPGQLFHFDQAHAQASEVVDELITAHRDELADGNNREISIAGLATYLERHSDAVSLAQFLAVAIDRLADGDAG